MQRQQWCQILCKIALQTVQTTIGKAVVMSIPMEQERNLSGNNDALKGLICKLLDMQLHLWIAVFQSYIAIFCLPVSQFFPGI